MFAWLVCNFMTPKVFAHTRLGTARYPGTTTTMKRFVLGLYVGQRAGDIAREAAWLPLVGTNNSIGGANTLRLLQQRMN